MLTHPLFQVYKRCPLPSVEQEALISTAALMEEVTRAIDTEVCFVTAIRVYPMFLSYLTNEYCVFSCITEWTRSNRCMFSGYKYLQSLLISDIFCSLSLCILMCWYARKVVMLIKGDGIWNNFVSKLSSKLVNSSD